MRHEWHKRKLTVSPAAIKCDPLFPLRCVMCIPLPVILVASFAEQFMNTSVKRRRDTASGAWKMTQFIVLTEFDRFVTIYLVLPAPVLTSLDNFFIALAWGIHTSVYQFLVYLHVFLQNYRASWFGLFLTIIFLILSSHFLCNEWSRSRFSFPNWVSVLYCLRSPKAFKSAAFSISIIGASRCFNGYS